MRLWRIPALLGVAAVVAGSYWSARTEREAAASQRRICQRAIISHGNEARVWQVLNRAKFSYPLRLSTFRGGPAARSSSWADDVARWLASWSPMMQATDTLAPHGSAEWALFQKEVLGHQPDLILLECAGSDAGTSPTTVQRNLERMVRAALAQPQHPAVILVFTTDPRGEQAQAIHEEVGRHYQLPMLSGRAALEPEVQAGRVAWAELATAEGPPSEAGNRWIAEIVERYFWEVRRLPEAPKEEGLPGVMGGGVS